jgi:hypothetical protein
MLLTDFFHHMQNTFQVKNTKVQWAWKKKELRAADLESDLYVKI